MPALEHVLKVLGKRREKLDALDAQLGNLIPRVEEALRSHIATRVFTVIESGEESWGRWLTFGKWDGRWQLLIEHGEVDNPEGWKTQPLSTGPRELKASVFVEGHVERLIRDALAQIDQQIKDREAATDIANALIGTLDGPHDPLSENEFGSPPDVFGALPNQPTPMEPDLFDENEFGGLPVESGAPPNQPTPTETTGSRGRRPAPQKRVVKS